MASELAADILHQKLKAQNEAIKEFARAASLFEEAGDIASATWARVGLAWSYADAGQLNEAQTIFSDSLIAGEHNPSSELVMNGHLGLGRVLEARGHFEEALMSMRRSYRPHAMPKEYSCCLPLPLVHVGSKCLQPNGIHILVLESVRSGS